MFSKKTSSRLAQINWFSNWTIEPEQILISLLVLGVLMVGSLLLRNPNMGADALIYHEAFHNLVAGKGWYYFIYGTYNWAPVEPGYGMLSYIFFLLFRDIEYSGMLVSAISYLLMIPITFFTVKFLFGKWSALLASFLITFWPTLISYSYINLNDCAFTFFLLFGFSLYTRMLFGKNTVLRSTLLGFILGFAYLIREPEGLLISGLAICTLFIFAIAELYKVERKQRIFISSAKSFLPPIATLLGFFVVALLYVAFIYAQSGVWSFSIKISPIRDAPVNMDAQVESSTTAIPVTSSNTAQVESNNTIPAVPRIATTPEAPNSNVSQKTQFFEGILSYSPHLGNIVKNASVLVRRLVSINAHALVPLILLGIISPFLLKKKFFTLPRLDSRRARLATSFAIFSSPVLPHLLVGALASRYLLQYSIFFLIAAAFLTVRILEKLLEILGKNHFDKWAILVCFLSVVVAIGYSSPSLYDVLTARHGHLGLRAAGLWLQDNVQYPDDLSIVASRKGSVALFYASGKEFSKGSSQNVDWDMTLDEIGILVNTDEIDYLLLENHYVHTLPQLEFLWDNPDLAQGIGLSLLYRDTNELFQIYTSTKTP